jgi:hypothetical protein
MQDHPSARLDLASLLSAFEDAPFSAADVLRERLASDLDAREVLFLIADFSGHALIRLGHTGSSAATGTQGDETAERVPLNARTSSVASVCGARTDTLAGRVDWEAGRVDVLIARHRVGVGQARSVDGGREPSTVQRVCAVERCVGCTNPSRQLARAVSDPCAGSRGSKRVLWP